MSIDKIIQLKSILEDRTTYLDPQRFTTDILSKYDQLENVPLAEDEQPAFEREKRALKNLIIQHIVFMVAEVLVPKIKAGEIQASDQAVTTWLVYANDFVEEATYLKLSHVIEQAKEIANLRETISESIDFIDAAEERFREEVDHQMHIESQELIRLQNRVNAKVEKLIKNLSDSEQFDLMDEVEDYRLRFKRFTQKVEAINLQLSAANTLLISGEYQKALDLYKTCEGPFALATSIDFDYIHGVFIDNKVHQNVSKEKAIEVTTNRWRIYSEFKYAEYVDTLGRCLPEDTTDGTISKDPYEVKARWEDNISKNLMPLDEITDVDVRQLVQNFNANLNKIIKRYDSYELDLRQKSQDPDYLSRYQKLLDFKNIIEPEIPLESIRDQWQSRLAEAKGLVGDFLQHKIEYFRNKFITAPEDVWQEIRQILNRITDDDFPDYYRSLVRISDVSEKFTEAILKLDSLQEPQEILDYISKIEDRLKPDLELPRILREKRKTYHTLKNPLQTADELVRQANEVKQNLANCEEFDLDSIERQKRDIELWLNSFEQHQDQADLANVKSRLENLKSLHSLLDEVIGFLNIQVMMAQSSPDIRRIQEKLMSINTRQLLEMLTDVRTQVEKWDRDDTRIKRRLDEIKSRVSSGGMLNLLRAYFDLRDLSATPTSRQAEINQILDELIVLINDGRRDYLERVASGEVDPAGLNQLIKFYENEIPGTNELEEYRQSILHLEAEKAEKDHKWFEAFLTWQRILNNNPDKEEIAAHMLACLKIFVLEMSIKEDFRMIQPYTPKFSDDMQILCINKYQIKAEFQQNLTQLDNINDTLMTNLDRNITDIRNHFSITENEPQNADEISIQESIFTQYLQRPEVAKIYEDFDQKFGHHQIQIGLEMLRDICGKVTVVVHKMDLENPVTDFYEGRKLVDIHITQPTLPDEGRELLQNLWDTLRLKLLAEVLTEGM